MTKTVKTAAEIEAIVKAGTSKSEKMRQLLQVEGLSEYKIAKLLTAHYGETIIPQFVNNVKKKMEQKEAKGKK
jgi:Xaa-Pro aminopeptidase